MRTFVYVGTSLDGFIAREDGNIEWLVKYESPELEDSFREFTSRIDAIVMGRGTYEKVMGFPTWPYDKKVFVLSSTIREVPAILREKVSILSMPPKALLNYFSSQGFSNIYVDGGKVIQSFLEEDCIDELIITTVPELIGSGIPLFGLLDNDLHFRHTSTHIFSNGLVKSCYERKR